MLSKNRYKWYMPLFYIVSGRRYDNVFVKCSGILVRENAGINNWSINAMDQSGPRLLLLRFGCDCCSIELRAVNPCCGARARCNSLFDKSLFYIYRPCSSLCRHYKCQPHFMQLDFDITCNKCFKYFPRWVRIFLIVFYFAFTRNFQRHI